MADTKEVTFKKDEEAIFAPLTGEEQPCTILRVPEDKKGKHLIQINGGAYSVNPCYLKKKK